MSGTAWVSGQVAMAAQIDLFYRQHLVNLFPREAGQDLFSARDYGTSAAIDKTNHY